MTRHFRREKTAPGENVFPRFPIDISALLPENSGVWSAGYGMERYHHIDMSVTLTQPPLIESKELIQTNERLRLLAWGFYIRGGMGLFFSMLFLLYALIFGAFSFMPESAFDSPQTTHSQNGTTTLQPPPDASGKTPNKSDAPPLIVFRIIAGVMLFVTMIAWTLCGLTAYAGRCIQKRKYRIFINVMAAFNTILIPYGTLLGVATFLVINTEESKAQFGAKP